jgi:hypothetical protein
MSQAFLGGLIVVIAGAVVPWWYFSGALLLDDTGFIYYLPFWQSQKFLWTDVDRFEINEDTERIHGNVVFDYAPREGTWAGKQTTAMSGRNSGLQDTAINTGLRPVLLLQLMREWRERALRH